MEICKPRRGTDEEIYGGDGLSDPIYNIKQIMVMLPTQTHRKVSTTLFSLYGRGG